MGSIKHHTIIVSTNFAKEILLLHKEAIRIFGKLVSPIVPSNRNDYQSFFVGPDGGKEEWQISEVGDEKRREFVELLNAVSENEDGGYLTFVEVSFGDEDGGAEIVNTTNHAH